jgi:hypothetical protein
VPSVVIRRSNEFEDFRFHKDVKVTHSVTPCNIYIIPQVAYLHFVLLFVNFLMLWCYIVSQCDTRHACHICEMCHTCHKYHCHVSLVIQWVIGGLLGTDFKQVRLGGWVKKCVKKWFRGLWRLLRSQPKAKRKTFDCFVTAGAVVVADGLAERRNGIRSQWHVFTLFYFICTSSEIGDLSCPSLGELQTRTCECYASPPDIIKSWSEKVDDHEMT